MSYCKIDNKYHGYIYKIYNTENDKIYIGQTRRSIDIRWKQHLLSSKSDKDKNTVLYRAMNKYGVDKFNIQLIQEYSFESKEELIKILNEEEIKYISKYNSIKPNGYNMQLGGKSPTESLKQPVDQYSLDGKLLNSYESLSEACSSSDKKLNYKHISECCRGKLYTSGGYVWRWTGEPFDKYDTSDKRYVPIDQYSKDGVFIKHYNSCADATYEVFGKVDKSYSSHIVSCCRGQRKTAYGFVWRYKNEPFGKHFNENVNMYPVN